MRRGNLLEPVIAGAWEERYPAVPLVKGSSVYGGAQVARQTPSRAGKPAAVGCAAGNC